MNPADFMPQMKMADLIESNYNVLLLLPRFRMRLGVGELSVADVCERHSISVHLFLLVCKIYSFPSYLVTKDELAGVSVSDLMLYLKQSHAYYRTERLVIIEDKLVELSSVLDKRSGAILLQFFEQYKTELINHFSYEERMVFPYITRLLEGVKPDNFNIHAFEENHSNIEEKLHDLKNILIKYLPTPDAVDYSDLLFHIYLLEDDLNKHTIVEDSILIPYVEQMEEMN
ncbi:MAG: hemerythrin domain-containing protein [Marinifilaceae bacterium]